MVELTQFLPFTKNIRRKLGMFKGEKFLADNYHLDDDNKEIEKLFSAD
ncbi:MAG: hypothetical protein U0M61_06150 [Succinivibrio sp.]|nr:hypothetical protein [Succinivibrio sp.]